MAERTPDRRSVTLQDVADAAGLHPSTVSRALDPERRDRVSDATREHVVAVAARLGYRPDMVARGLKSGRTGALGVVVADLGNIFVTPLVHGIADAIDDAGMMSVVAESRDDRDRFAGILDHMLSRRVDALVILAARTGDRELVEMANRSVPVVLASRPLEDTPVRQVIHDNDLGGALVAEHLHALGHRIVAQLRGPDDVLNFPRRAHGFMGRVEALGMELADLDGVAAHPTQEEGRRLMEDLLDTRPRLPSAVFAHNDLMAIGALTALKSRGLRVPDDISLVGYNDMPLADQVSPPLTTVRYQTHEVGRRAGEMVLALLAGDECEDVVLTPTLVARGSTRRAG
jgi:LacI family transcriptional regulator